MLGMILPVAGALLLLLANKKKATAQQAPLPTPTVEDLREGVKTPATTGKTRTPISKTNPVVEVGNGTLGDVLWAPVRTPTKQAPTKPTKTPPVVTTKPGQTLGDIFWGPVRPK